MSSEFRALSSEETTKLTEQGCSCDDWSNVQVAKDFKAEKVKSTHFSGKVKLGIFDKQVSFAGGVKKPAGISSATIHNCTIGNNVYINQIGNYIANYHIEDGVIIENVDLLSVDRESSFGNGTEAAVVNEAGGREIPIYDHLSTQIAYIIAFYRHRPKVIKSLQKMIAGYTASVTSSMGLVSKGAKIVNCRTIRNVKADPSCTIDGAERLENGSVNSCPEDPAYIGAGVIAENFIACTGSKITDAAMISNCFVGQGTVIGRQYSAENSVFFANCEGFQGEACSIFAGPYTVTHHKSTLLIAGLFSFLNAGSGTNQSNHMYKLGPAHQGVLERGCKTASDSYILWPAKIGAYSVVVGRHYEHLDTSDFPFSYIIEQNKLSILTPGSNFRRVGLVRDIKKWPTRDRRKSPQKLDLINFELLSPYIMQKVLKSYQLLTEHKAKTDGKSDFLFCPGVTIKAAAIDNGIKLYERAIDEFLGDCLIKQLETKQFNNIGQLQTELAPETKVGTGKWVDLGGLFAPQETVEKMLDDIEKGSISSLEQLTEALRSMDYNYSAYEWAWASEVLQQRLGKAANEITADNIIELITKWKRSIKKVGRQRLVDAQKEFIAPVQIGYGIDGEQECKQADFEAVRGRFEENSFVCDSEKNIKANTKRAEELINRIENIR
ncbi:MAG: DUF4954 family protein [Planctomycetota bacterium]|jgi:NDP-sugar pyrophosphorylase family protein